MFSGIGAQLFMESNCYNGSWHGLAPDNQLSPEHFPGMVWG